MITAYHAKYFAHELSRRHSSMGSNNTWRSYDDAAHALENQKDTLLDQVEAQLQQQVVSTVLFTVRGAVT